MIGQLCSGSAVRCDVTVTVSHGQGPQWRRQLFFSNVRFIGHSDVCNSPPQLFFIVILNSMDPSNLGQS